MGLHNSQRQSRPATRETWLLRAWVSLEPGQPLQQRVVHIWEQSPRHYPPNSQANNLKNRGGPRRRQLDALNSESARDEVRVNWLSNFADAQFSRRLVSGPSLECCRCEACQREAADRQCAGWIPKWNFLSWQQNDLPQWEDSNTKR